MNTRRALFARWMLSIVLFAAALSWAGAPPARAADDWSAVRVPVTGTVFGAQESIVFSGYARVAAKLSRDPDVPAKGTLLIRIDLSEVTGVGSATQARYVTPIVDTMDRPLAPSDLIEIPFSFYGSADMGATPADAALASFAAVSPEVDVVALVPSTDALAPGVSAGTAVAARTAAVSTGVAVASFALAFDAATGAITSASASILTPNFPK
jgi:hypothetical protein